MKPESERRSIPAPISLVLSDVDGTLVTPDKRLTPAAVAAARALRDRNIRFTVASSRPPFGLRAIADALELDLPMAAFNGGLLIDRWGRSIAEHWVPTEVASAAIAFFQEWRLEIWGFTAREWLCKDPQGEYVAHETQTVSQQPTVVDSFEPYLHALGKIVAVSGDRDRLVQCEAAAQARFGRRAEVARSQAYYLDVTSPHANKGEALLAFATAFAVPLSECVAIGDGPNDVGMLRAAAYGVAMGNSVPALRDEADFVSHSNQEEGFAHAIERLLGGPR